MWFLGNKAVDKVVRDGEIVYSRNLILNSSAFIELEDKDETFTKEKKETSGLQKNINELAGKEITVSVDVEVKNAIKRLSTNSMRVGFEGKAQTTEGTMHWIGVWYSFKEGESFKGRISKTIELKRYTGNFVNDGINIETAGDYLYVGNPKIEFGSTATPYTVAPEDMFSSTATLPAPDTD